MRGVTGRFSADSPAPFRHRPFRDGPHSQVSVLSQRGNTGVEFAINFRIRTRRLQAPTVTVSVVMIGLKNLAIAQQMAEYCMFITELTAPTLCSQINPLSLDSHYPLPLPMHVIAGSMAMSKTPLYPPSLQL